MCTNSSAIRLLAPAKINLFLHINARRNDGHHQLQTAYQFLDYSDTVTVRVHNNRRIRSRGEPRGGLALRAARLLQVTTGVGLGAEIQIDKQLPIGGGLGGGSADAAAVLIALNRLWKTRLGRGALARLGARLGADVPLFIYSRAAWGEGVGDLLWPMDFEEAALVGGSAATVRGYCSCLRPPTIDPQYAADQN